MAITFEAADCGVVEVGRGMDLAEASAALPAGAYTTLRTYRTSRVLRIDDHVARLEASVAAQGNPARLEGATVRRAIAGVLSAAGFPESRLRITFAPPRLFLSIEPFTTLPDAFYREGVACTTLPLRRDNPLAKDTRFIAQALGAYRTLARDVHEGLLVSDDGVLLEGLTSNFFAVKNGALLTHEGGVLPGITRSLVLELARPLVQVFLVPVRKQDLPDLDEAFLTSASRGVLPVVRIDDTAIGQGRPGNLSMELMRRWQSLVEREAEDVHG